METSDLSNQRGSAKHTAKLPRDVSTGEVQASHDKKPALLSMDGLFSGVMLVSGSVLFIVLMKKLAAGSIETT